SKPRTRSAKNKRSKQGEGTAGLPGSGSKQTTSDKIEEERGRLMVAETLLHCAVVAMEEGDVGDEPQGPYVPAVIGQARELINYSIRELETVEMELGAKGRTKYEVKEEAAEYVH